MSGDRVATERLWRTADDKVVFDGDEAAVQLIAAEGDVIPEGYDAPKRATKPADKNVEEPNGGDKSVGPEGDKSGTGSGVTITRAKKAAAKAAPAKA